jgi:Transposase DDE domain
MIPASLLFDQSTLTALLEHDPLIQDYRAFFALLDWSLVDHWQAPRSSRGRPAHPESAYLKAFLIRIREGLLFTSQLRRFLLKHPLLVIELGFHLELTPNAAYGFDAQQTIPSEQWLREKLRTFDQALLQDLLAATVVALQEEIPGLGETVAFDVKHIYAWVKQNNERVYVKDRYDKEQRLAGDADGRLGVKKSSNQEQDDGPTKEKKEYIWGYGSGVAAATTPDYGDVVLGEYTQPCNENDVTYFRPLYKRTLLALNQFPTHITADAAFDAWYVYECAARHHGRGAVPLNQHGHPVYQRDTDGVPLCPERLRMSPTYQFAHPYGYRAQRFRCPLLYPQPTGQTCPHAQFAKGKGCVKDVNWELGAQMRVTLDRDSPLYHAVYTQRTCCERINSQAQALGIERPKVRNGNSVKNLNTLIYLVINVRALAKAQAINEGLLLMNYLRPSQARRRPFSPTGGILPAGTAFIATLSSAKAAIQPAVLVV